MFGCSDDAVNLPAPYYSIEGKWLYPSDTPGIGSQGISNTMYLFEDGIRYTYYCTEN